MNSQRLDRAISTGEDYRMEAHGRTNCDRQISAGKADIFLVMFIRRELIIELEYPDA